MAQLRGMLVRLIELLPSFDPQLQPAVPGPASPATRQPDGKAPLETRHRKLKDMYWQLQQRLDELQARSPHEPAVRAAATASVAAAASPGPAASHPAREQLPPGSPRQQQPVMLWKEPYYSQLKELGITNIALCPY